MNHKLEIGDRVFLNKDMTHGRVIALCPNNRLLVREERNPEMVHNISATSCHYEPDGEELERRVGESWLREVLKMRSEPEKCLTD